MLFKVTHYQNYFFNKFCNQIEKHIVISYEHIKFNQLKNKNYGNVNTY